MAETDSPELALRLQVLRERLSSVVGEVRRSVQTLRTSVGENESLGTAIGALARHLSTGSGVPIQVTLDESTQRLRPEVEAELLRIAQEAMNNAVRHAEANLIEVQCTVDPPRGRDRGRRRRTRHPLPPGGLPRPGDHGASARGWWRADSPWSSDSRRARASRSGSATCRPRSLGRPAHRPGHAAAATRRDPQASGLGRVLQP